MTRSNLRASASALVLAGAALGFGAATAQADLPAYRAAVLADGPVAYWPLDETSGALATDLGSGGHSGGVPRGGPARAPPGLQPPPPPPAALLPPRPPTPRPPG